MGTRSTDTLNEIEQVRSRLDRNVAELERRLPPAAQLARRAAGIALGGGVGGSALWFAVRKLRPKKSEPELEPEVRPVVVNLVPKGLVPVAVGAVAVWAGIRFYEMKLRAEREGTERPGPAVVRPMAEGPRAAGEG